jgi:hypothetical protein
MCMILCVTFTSIFRSWTHEGWNQKLYLDHAPSRLRNFVQILMFFVILHLLSSAKICDFWFTLILFCFSCFTTTFDNYASSRTIARSTTFTMPRKTSTRKGPFHMCKNAKIRRGPRRRRPSAAYYTVYLNNKYISRSQYLNCPGLVCEFS